MCQGGNPQQRMVTSTKARSLSILLPHNNASELSPCNLLHVRYTIEVLFIWACLVRLRGYSDIGSDHGCCDDVTHRRKEPKRHGRGHMEGIYTMSKVWDKRNPYTIKMGARYERNPVIHFIKNPLVQCKRCTQWRYKHQEFCGFCGGDDYV